MIWWRVASVVIALGLVTALAWPGAAVTPRITENRQRPVTIATLPCSTRLQSTSSGFVIDDELVVTVAHAIYESRDFAVRDSTGRWHHASVQFMDLERDLAVLRVRALGATPMATRPAMNGDRVVMLEGAASGTVGGEIMRRVGITTEVIGDRSQSTRRSGYELTIDIQGGDSGSAVIDESGSLVGVVFARSTGRDASWATSVTEMAGIVDARGVPEWTCDRPSDAELVLEPLEQPTTIVN